MYSSLVVRVAATVSVVAALLVGVVVLPVSVSPASAAVFVTALIPVPSAGGREAGPFGVAVDPDTQQAYVANSANDTVSVIDTRTRTLTTTVPGTFTGARAVAIDAAHHQAYVVNSGSATVSVIDTITNRVTTVIPSTGFSDVPYAIDVDTTSGRAYVSSLLKSVVSVIDTATNTVLKVIPHDATNGIGSQPTDVAVDATTHRAYVANNGDDTVSVVDTTSDSVITVLPHDETRGIGSEPSQIAIDQDAHRAFVSNYASGTVSVIDTTTDTVIAVLPHDPANGIGDTPEAVSVDSASHQLLVASNTQITAFDTVTLNVTGIMRSGTDGDYGTGIRGIAADPVHHQAFVTGETSNTVAVVDSTGTLSRRGGADRFEVSAAISAAEFSPGVDVAYIASGTAFADALSGSAAAGSRGAPVLLTATDTLPTSIRTELTRLKPKKIIVLGGTASINDTVLTTLAAYSPTVTRLAGPDRYAVAAEVSHDTFTPGLDLAYVASGEVFPDALAGSAVAGAKHAPVLLTTKNTLPKATTDELTRLHPLAIIILGGPNTITTDLENHLRDYAPTVRLAGADRFDVAATTATATYPTGTDTVYIASGAVFPDALSGSPAAADNNAPVLLTTKDTLPTATTTALTQLHPTRLIVLGGPNTISDAVYESLRGYLR
ncbi:cell wall-binding repeat-containing protein [Herbiconiux daphne]|uniref:Cell wall-binding repeat-containing protein n=1 Tax=Herbiconiux daphne TaxID=2970914 RepID=A0ABT2H436_9MICO|nr:cell wall-binding repeat-containing protein [Herbiconiux daphne]MCS5734674.1 cell wall-binding repeat-containing protein [Herbiconiux daphne]